MTFQEFCYLDLYRQLVESESLKEHHLDPLEGDPDDTWRPIAVAALDRGYSGQDVLNATIFGPRIIVGPASEMWAGLRRAFEELLNDPDPRIVAEMGREMREAVEGLA